MGADLAGFTDAQKRLREEFGEAVRFERPGVATYPAGTKLGEDGKPLDPLVQPIGETDFNTVVKCNVAFRSKDPAGDQAGWHDVEHVRLIADISDRDKIDGATHALLRGQRYEVVSTTPDGIGGVQRYLVEARKV